MTENKQLIQQQIENWIRRHVIIPAPGWGSCEKLVLQHLDLEGQAQEVVSEVPIPVGEPRVGEIEAIIDAVVEAAQRHANVYDRGLQQYGIYAHYHSSKRIPRKVFRAGPEY